MKNIRRNPPIEQTLIVLAPILPYLVVGITLYFFGDKILAWAGSKFSGVSSQKLIEDTSTVYEAVSHPIEELKNEIITVYHWIVPNLSQDKFKLDTIKTALDRGWVTMNELPYPIVNNATELTANYGYVGAKIVRLRGQK